MLAQAKTQPQNLDTWGTPAHVYGWAQHRWGEFQLDIAASRENHLAPNWYGLDGEPGVDRCMGNDGTRFQWSIYSRAWCNPPFSNIENFVKRIDDRKEAGKTVVMLVPANRTNQDWFRMACKSATRIIYITPRVAYVDPLGANRSAPGFASCIFAWDGARAKTGIITEFVRITTQTGELFS